MASQALGTSTPRMTFLVILLDVARGPRVATSLVQESSNQPKRPEI